MTTILIGDVGGTNARLRLFQVSESSVTDIKIDSIETAAHTNFISLLRSFLTGFPSPRFCVFAIAGVAKGISARFVNQKWDPIKEYSSNIEKELDVEKVVFLNDFEASGYGCLEMNHEDFVQINKTAKLVRNKRIVVMGPGTGLGECTLIFKDGAYSSWPGEGGHCDFAPHNDEQWRFAKFMMDLVQTADEYAKFRPCEHVSNEVCVAGVGAYHIYDFYRQEHPELVDPEFDSKWNSGAKDKIKYMMIEGFNNTNQLCRKSVELWLKLLAYECGNMIAKNLPFSGVYLTGGLVSKNYEQFVNHGDFFMENLLTKPIHICEVIKKIPIYVVKREDIGMLGAFGYAVKTFT